MDTKLLARMRPLKIREPRYNTDRHRFFKERGWICVEDVLSCDEAEQARVELVRMAKDKLGNEDRHVKDLAASDYDRLAQAVNEPSRYSDVFRRIVRSPKIAEIVKEVTGLSSIRVFRDLGLIKAPESEKGIATGVHQDLPFYPMDRCGGAAIWLALCDLPAEAGTLRFVDASHKWGPVGRYVLPGQDWLAAHPEDEELMTEPLALSAGSATIHDGLMLHGTDPNRWNQHRFGYTIAYMPADARFTGMPTRWTDGLGLKVDGLFDHEFFPVVG